MKYYCAECFEEIGNCAAWCSEAARERNQGPKCKHPGCKHTAGQCGSCPIHCICPTQDH